jgi:non-homologous end joining protein Ku
MIDASIKAKTMDQLKEKSDLLIQLIDPSKKEWVPSKVKKQIVERIKEVIKSSPKTHSAQEKLMALQLLNRAILKKNQEFNR